MLKLKERLPDDCSPSVLLSCWAHRSRRLWLILDETDKFLGFCTTEIETLVPTGERIAVLKDMAGEGILGAADQICATLEAYADREQVRIRQIVGRKGWEKVSSQYGYRTHSVILRKVVER